METKKYWFALKSHVYVAFKKEKILLYDTHSGRYMITSSAEVIALVSELYEFQNLGVTSLNMDRRAIPAIRKFVHEIQEKQMGDLSDMEKMPQKPVRLIPILNLQKDVDKTLTPPFFTPSNKKKQKKSCKYFVYTIFFVISQQPI